MNEIHLIPTAGLCNRLRAIASSVYIAQKLNLPLRIFWNRYDGLNANFEDLFLPIPSAIATLTDSKSWRYDINYTKDYLLRWPFLQSYQQIIYNFTNQNGADIFPKLKKRNGKILLISCHTMSDMYDLNKLFVPQSDIQASIEEITQLFTSHTIGVHIRRTDNALSIADSPIEEFITMMEGEIHRDNDVSFYLATDDDTTKEYIRQKFPDRIITYEKDTSRDSLEGMKFAVAELFTLSKTNKIIGSNYSSY